MNSNKQRRGRPVGTGLDDAPILSKIADMMLANPLLKPTTAIRRCLDNPGLSNVRRLQVKWKAAAADYLAQAEKRHAAALVPSPARRIDHSYIPHTTLEIMEAQRNLQALMESPTMCATQEIMNSPAMFAAHEAARRIEDSTGMRAIQEYMKSPAMRAIKEFNDSATMRAMRDVMDSPAMRTMRETSDELARVHRYISGTRF